MERRHGIKQPNEGIISSSSKVIRRRGLSREGSVYIADDAKRTLQKPGSAIQGTTGTLATYTTRRGLETRYARGAGS